MNNPTQKNSDFHYNHLQNRLLRLPEVLTLIPVSKSTWWAGVASGRFPKSVKIGPRTTAWRASDIYQLLEELSSEDQ